MSPLTVSWRVSDAASFTGEPKGRGFTSLCLLHSVLPRLHCPASTRDPESSLSGCLFPTELRTKKEDCPTPSSQPACGVYKGRLRRQKPSPAPASCPLVVPKLPEARKTSYIQSNRPISLKSKATQLLLSPCVRKSSSPLSPAALPTHRSACRPPLSSPDLGSRTRYEGSPSPSGLKLESNQP